MTRRSDGSRRHTPGGQAGASNGWAWTAGRRRMRVTRSKAQEHDADAANDAARRDQAHEAEEVEHEVNQLASGRPPTTDRDEGASEGETIPEHDDVVEAEVPSPDTAPEEQSDATDEASTSRPLGELLVGRGLVSEDELRDALTKQTASGKRLGNLLVELELLDERTLTDVLAEQLGLTVVDLSRADIDPEVVALLTEEDARRLG